VQFERRRIDKFSVCAKGSSGATPDHRGQKSQHHLSKIVSFNRKFNLGKNYGTCYHISYPKKA